MLISVRDINSESAKTALDTFSMSLAFDKEAALVFLGSCAGFDKHIRDRISSAADLGLTSIFILSDKETDLPCENIPGVVFTPISHNELRQLCGTHAAVLNF